MTRSFATLAIALSTLQPTPAHQTGAVAIHSAGAVDVRGGRVVPETVVLVQGDRITSIGSPAAVQVPVDATRIDLGNATLLPGLVDAHVHLTLAGAAAANARQTLDAGFTTVQDLGAVDYATLALRDAIAAGQISGPRVVASGPWLGIAKGICDFGGIGVRGAEAFRARVRQDIERGADLIKVCVSGWLNEALTSPSHYEISDAELHAAIDEAHRLNRRVAVHAISAAGIGVAVRMGADLVVHGGFVDATTVKAMRARKVFMLPTLMSFAGSNSPDALARLESHLRTSVKIGLPVAFGTDAGVIAHGTNTGEFEYLTHIGLDPAGAIRAATINGAAAVGMEGKVGALEAGMVADIIATEGNPLQDLTALRRVRFVMKGGQVIRK